MSADIYLSLNVYDGGSMMITHKPLNTYSWKRIKYNEHYMEAIFRKLEIEKDTEKYNQIFDELRNYGAIAA